MADIDVVIKIDEEKYEIIKAYTAPMTWTEYLIKNGTPLDKHDEEVIAETVESIWGKPPYIDMLDKIRAEITEYAIPDFEYHGCGGSQKIVELEDVLEIIDKYKAESEIHCNCTDKEIAKSFIEDVEAVKDLLPKAESEVSKCM